MIVLTSLEFAGPTFQLMGEWCMTHTDLGSFWRDKR